MSTETEKNSEVVKAKKKDISAQVLSKIEGFQEAGELRLPADYSAENALKSAYLVLSETKNKEGKYALSHCNTTSVANALLKMVIWGLSPLKKQCDFIMYGNQLECSIEYTGNIALAKRYGGLKNIKANAVFESDKFEFEVDGITGRKTVKVHSQSLDSLGSKKIKGAYAIMEMNDGTVDTEIMSFSQIQDAWNQGAMKGNSPAHKNFPDQMCIKTVINRACKLLIRGSNDSILYSDDDYKSIDVASENVKHKIKENANKRKLDFDEADYEEVHDPEEVKGTDDEENQRLLDEALADEENKTAKATPDF